MGLNSNDCQTLLESSKNPRVLCQYNAGTQKYPIKPGLTIMVAANARTYLQLPLRQWGASNVYLLVLSSWKVNIAENPIAVMGL